MGPDLISKLYTGRKDHIHFDVPRSQSSVGTLTTCYVNIDEYLNGVQEGGNTVDTIKALEAEADALMVRLAEAREFASREPQGEEPVITWKHTFNDQPGGSGTNYDRKEYTYVAVKLSGGWYVTGQRHGSAAFSWELLGRQPWAKALKTGDFHLCTEWTYQGEAE